MTTEYESAISDNQTDYSGEKNEGLQVLRDFLPWSRSVSDPGVFVLSPIVENLPREYASSPLHGRFQQLQKQVEPSTTLLNNAGFQLDEQNRDQGNKCLHVLLRLLSSTTFLRVFILLKAIRSKIMGNRDFFKWVFTLLNLVVELCQAIFSQEKNDGEMGRNVYLKLSIITSSICLMMAIFEAFYEGKRVGVVWQKRGCCGWFYYPGNEGRLFGRFSLYFSLISSMIQLFINLLERITNKDMVKFDYIQLLLAICYLAAAIVGTQQKTPPPSEISIRCNVHGFSAAEGTILEGHESRVFQCPHCQIEQYRVLNRF